MKKITLAIKFLIYLIIFLLPIQTRWIIWRDAVGGNLSEYATYSLYGLDILIGVLFLLAVLKFVISAKKWREILPVNWRLTGAIISLLLISIVSIGWADDKLLSLYYLGRLIELIALGIIIRHSGINLKKAIVVFVAAAFIQSLLAFWQFFTQYGFASKWFGMAVHDPRELGVSVVEVGESRYLRAYGSLPHPNILGGFLAAAYLFLLGISYGFRKKLVENILTNRQKVWQAVLIYGAMPIIFGGLMLTFSRSAWIGFAGGLVGAWLFLIIKKIRLKYWPELESMNLLLFTIYTILFFIFFAVILNEPLMARLKGEGRLEDRSIGERELSLSESCQIISKNWLLGVGIGNYTLAASEMNKENQAEKCSGCEQQPVHNLYLLILSELGILGLAAYLLTLGLIIKISWRKYWREGSIGIAAIIPLLLIGLFDHYLGSLWPGLILLGITLILITQPEGNS